MHSHGYCHTIDRAEKAPMLSILLFILSSNPAHSGLLHPSGYNSGESSYLTCCICAVVPFICSTFYILHNCGNGETAFSLPHLTPQSYYCKGWSKTVTASYTNKQRPSGVGIMVLHTPLYMANCTSLKILHRHKELVLYQIIKIKSNKLKGQTVSV